MATPLVVSEVGKSFTMHLRGSVRLGVVENVSFSLRAGECAVLGGPSGAGKSSIVKMLYGNYAVDTGQKQADEGRQPDGGQGQQGRDHRPPDQLRAAAVGSRTTDR